MNCENTKNSIWFELTALEHLLHRRINQKAREQGIDDVTMMHSYIIHFLYMHQDISVFQKDLEKKFHLTRSSITNIMQNLEKSGFIKRESVPNDARLKKVTLTDCGLELHEKIGLSMKDADAYLTSALSPEESAIFLSLCQKLRNTLETEGKHDN